MGFLFESFILPLSILLTIPLASIGVVWAHARPASTSTSWEWSGRCC